MATVAGRLLARAPSDGSERWLALAATCILLHDITGDPLYQEQASEARYHARAGWHPAATAIDTLTGSQRDSRRDVLASIALRLARRGLDEAVRTRDAGGVARAAFALGDDARVDRALRQAGRADPLAASVAASRVLRQSISDVPAAVARQAIPEEQLEAVRRCLANGARARAGRLARDLDWPQRERAQLIIALDERRQDDAHLLAVSLAREGVWDPTVAALVFSGPAPEPLRSAARDILTAAIPTPNRQASVPERLAGLAENPDDPGRWVLAIESLVDQGRLLDAVTAVGLAGADHGVVPWALLANTMQVAGQSDTARLIIDQGARRFPDSVVFDLLRSSLALASNDQRSSLEFVEHATTDDPSSPAVWLARALILPGRSGARDAVETARLMGADTALADWVASLIVQDGRPHPRP